MTAPNRPMRAAVLGHPIAHSLSPVLHRAAYAALGLPWTYTAVDVTVEQLPAVVAGLDDEWVGLSLTMPLKEAVLPLLDSTTSTVDLTRAANTLVVERDGSRSGHNTDVDGVIAALQERGVRSVREAAVLGSGATARSVLVALQRWGVTDVLSVSRPGASRDALQELAERLGLRWTVVEWGDAAGALARPLVVNTAPGAVADGLAAVVPTDPGVIFDVRYDPWPTPVAEAWARAGGTVVGGLDLLIHQAVGQVRLMTGRPVDASVLRDALKQSR